MRANPAPIKIKDHYMGLDQGTRIGPYEILSALGAGGMGEVYCARDTKLNRDVALKVLPEAVAHDAERMARFQREAQVLASLNHANIAAIYGLEDSGGTRALVMELVEGPTLAQLIETRNSKLENRKSAPGTPTSFEFPVSSFDVLHVAKQVAEALEYAHERGIIHRDLKPANIKISSEGAVKVLDFGLAKALATEASGGRDVSNSPTLTAAATQAGVILGTAAYMSPEQARGKTVDRRTDIWSFGCLLYELLTGKRLFHEDTVSDTLAAVLKTEPDWNALPADASPRIRDLIRRCLIKDPKQRLRDIGEARITIEETLAGGTGAPPVEATVLGRQQGAPLRPWLIGLTSIILGALVAGLAVWRLAAPAARAKAMHFSAVTNFAGVQAQPSLSPDGRSLAFVSNHNGQFNVYVGLLNGGSLVQVTNDTNLKGRPCYSPDGTTIAYARLNDSGIWDIWDVPALGGSPRRVILDAWDPAWSPDGRTLAYENLATGTIWASDVGGQNARQLTPPESPGFEDTEPRFSPNGRSLALVIRLGGGPYGELAVADLNSGKVNWLTHDQTLVLSPAWTPDSQSIYFASSRGGTINIWKIAASGGEPEQITAGQGDDAQLDVSADGKRIVFSTFRENINIVQSDWDSKPGPGSVKPLTSDPARNQIDPVYSPDGRHLAYFSNRKGYERETIWVADSDGSNPTELIQDAQINVFPRWTADGAHLIYRSGSPKHDLENTEYRSVPIEGGAPQTVLKRVLDLYFDVGPDGRLLFRGPEGKIQSYDPASKQSQTLAVSPASPRCWLPRWSPEGHSMTYVVNSARENDPDAGLWMSDFKNPPRQIFQGWVLWYSNHAHDGIYILQGKPELTGEFWKITWNGQERRRVGQPIHLIYSYWIRVRSNSANSQDYFDVSPDGKHLAINTQGVLQANIGMIENARE